MKITKIILLCVLLCGIICIQGGCEAEEYEPGQLVWKYEMGLQTYSIPTVHKGLLFVGNGYPLAPFYTDQTIGNLYCINAKTGKRIWRFNSGGTVWGSPVVANNYVYFSSAWSGKFGLRSPKEGRLYCLNARTGLKIWTFKTPHSLTSPAVKDGYVYTGGRGKIYCLDADSGQKVWEHSNSRKNRICAVYDGRLYNNGDDPKVLCLDSENGNKIWDFTTKDDFLISSPGVNDGHVYIMGYGLDRNFYNLDAETGEQIWTFDMDTFSSSPSIAEGKVYFGSGDGIIYCIDSESGRKIWEYITGSNSRIEGSPAITNGYIYIESGDHWLLCLNADTGELVWKHDMGKDISSAVIEDGFVYLTDVVGNVYCLKAAEEEDGSWPIYRGNPARTGSND